MAGWGEAPICVTCGVQQAVGPVPERCVVCDDERQYVGEHGQRWTTSAELAATHTSVLREEEPGLLGLGLEPSFGIGQRALLVQTPAGNVLWDCVAHVDDAAAAEIERLGGVDAIAISHPHFYAACADVAEVFDAPIHLPRADAHWVRRPSERIVPYDDEVEPVPGVTVVRVGGHFDGAAVLHWPGGAGGRGVLLTGDSIMVVPDRAWVSFMWSYPNLLPLDAASVRAIAAGVARFDADRLYAGWWGRCVPHDAAAIVQRSAQRYVDRLNGVRPPS